MIGKVLRGRHVARLLYYLYGPGKHEEHTDPHIVTGWRHPAELEPPLVGGGGRDFRRLTGLLEQPVAVLGARAPGRPVWHCVARAAPTDRLLSDEEWAQAAAEIMHRTGLAPRGEDDEAVRWIAVRHGPDHIHIVATLARQDGGRPRLSGDYYKVREACRAVEEAFRLRRTAPGDRTAACRPSRAETEKAGRRGWREAPRVVLQREVSTAAGSACGEREFFARLENAGVLVRLRYSVRNPGEVTGYAVALPADTTAGGTPVWYGGGKLAADLTLPKLRHRWTASAMGGTAAGLGGLTAGERAAIWEQAGQACSAGAAQIRALTAAGDCAGAADAAWAAADALRSAGAALGHPAIRRAANAYDRAARMPYGRVPRASRAGCELRRAARLMSAAAFATHDRHLAQLALMTRLAALTEAVAQLRLAQGHVAQAEAARAAAEMLHAGTAASAAPPGQAPARRSATAVSRAAFPAQPSSSGRRNAPLIPERAGTPAPHRPVSKRPRR
ncbi:MAG TPA: hypothetical protein VFQ44_09520 [Streptosporangiaceae bacterium]|nr:hypothetical protein [Streptosporangiaceae bacterium]